MPRDITEIRQGLAGFGLTPTNDSLDAMLALIGQPHPELLIWAYTGAKGHSDYFRIDEISIPREEFDALLDRAGLEVKRRVDLQRKGWPDWQALYEGIQGLARPQDVASGVWYGIPECCAMASGERTEDDFRRFFADHPLDGCTDADGWSDAKEAEGMDAEGICAMLKEHMDGHGFRAYQSYIPIEDEMKRRISAGELPHSLFLLSGLTYTPCAAGCEPFTQMAERMYRSLAIFLGEERADSTVSEHERRWDGG